MLREVQTYIWDGSASGTVALVFAVLSVLVAFYAHAVLNRMTRRAPFDGKQFGVVVDPWMAEARRSYAKQKLARRREKGEL